MNLRPSDSLVFEALQRLGPCSPAMLKEALPGLSSSAQRSSRARLLKDGFVASEGSGRSATYRAIRSASSSDSRSASEALHPPREALGEAPEAPHESLGESLGEALHDKQPRARARGKALKQRDKSSSSSTRQSASSVSRSASRRSDKTKRFEALRATARVADRLSRLVAYLTEDRDERTAQLLEAQEHLEVLRRERDALQAALAARPSHAPGASSSMPAPGHRDPTIQFDGQRQTVSALATQEASRPEALAGLHQRPDLRRGPADPHGDHGSGPGGAVACVPSSEYSKAISPSAPPSSATLPDQSPPVISPASSAPGVAQPSASRTPTAPVASPPAPPSTPAGVTDSAGAAGGGEKTPTDERPPTDAEIKEAAEEELYLHESLGGAKVKYKPGWLAPKLSELRKDPARVRDRLASKAARLRAAAEAAAAPQKRQARGLFAWRLERDRVLELIPEDQRDEWYRKFRWEDSEEAHLAWVQAAEDRFCAPPLQVPQAVGGPCQNVAGPSGG